MRSMGDPAYVYRPQSDEHREKRSAVMKKIIARRIADGRGWSGNLWSKEEVELLNFMYDEGMRRDEIGQAIKRTTDATRAKLDDSGEAYARRAGFQKFRREGRKT